MPKEQPTTPIGSAPEAGSSPAPNAEATSAPALTLEIPVLSAEQVKASSPEAVGALQNEGKAQAEANLKALQAAFPNDAAFVLECQSKGLNVDQAKAAKFDAVSAELNQTKLKLKEHEDKAAHAATTPSAPVVTYAAGDVRPDGKSGAPAPGTKPTEDEWQARSAQVWQKNPHLATEFETQGDFLAYYKRNPNEDYSKRRD